MNLTRTDLAVETAEALPTGRDMFAPGTGVTKSECLLCGCPVTRIHVHTPAGARAIGKPEGRYITIDLRPALSRQEALTGRAALCLCRELRALLPPPSDGPALVVGLGNDAMTPDAVGAAALEHLLVTRHMVRSMPRQFGALTPVAALATGVLARTGVETLELIRGAADRLHPSVVIAIDALAAETRSVFAERHLEAIMPSLPQPTGTVIAEIDESGVAHYTFPDNVAWDNIPFTPEMEAMAHQTRAVCWGSLAQRSDVSRQSILRFVDTVPDGPGQYKIFDINLRQNFYTREVITESLERANVLKINDEELVVVARMFGLQGTDLEAKCRTLLTDYHLDMLILTCGENGSYIFTPATPDCPLGGTSFMETPRVEVSDTIGAGDSFTGTLVASLIEGMPVRQAHARAVKVSAYVCTQPGAMPILPDSVKQG